LGRFLPMSSLQPDCLCVIESARNMLKLPVTLLLSLHACLIAEPIVINSERIRLGEPNAPEWEWFEKDPPRVGPLELRFQGKANAEEATLFIRQADVKLEWRVQVNGKRLGHLSLMEEDLTSALAIPPNTLREGENVLSILAPVGNADDIVLQDIRIDARPLNEAIGEAGLTVHVESDQGAPLPARVTVVDDQGALATVRALPGETLAVRPGVAYTGTGVARIGARAGRYTVYASRGFEYSMASQVVELRRGENREVRLRIAREVPTPGLVSCDTHLHTLTLSGHGDSTLDERMFTIAGEGVELPVATEHNRHADYAEAAKRTGMAKYFTPIRGNEVTTSVGHFNIFPVEPGAPVPDAKLTAWPDLLRAMRATPGVKAIVLNHPRSIHTKFRPFGPENFDAATGENRAGLDFSFDALEAINSGAQQTDYMLVLRDWFALLNRGHRIVAVGASDSHDVSRFIVGQARTYISARDEDPGKIDIEEACTNLVAGKASVSMGLLPQMTVDEHFSMGDLATDLKEKVRIRVKVLGPSWVKASKVELFANGVKLEEMEIGPQKDAAGVKASVTWTIPRPRVDTYLVAIATGPAVTAPFWAMSRPYQPASPKWQGRAIGLTNPIWLDADGDGKFTAVNEKRR
jgi:hypothetical protein